MNVYLKYVIWYYFKYRYTYQGVGQLHEGQRPEISNLLHRAHPDDWLPVDKLQRNPPSFHLGKRPAGLLGLVLPLWSVYYFSNVLAWDLRKPTPNGLKTRHETNSIENMRGATQEQIRKANKADHLKFHFDEQTYIACNNP